MAAPNRQAKIAFFLAALPLLWVFAFCVLVSIKASSQGLSVLNEVEFKYWLRLGIAAVLGLGFLAMGVAIKTTNAP